MIIFNVRLELYCLYDVFWQLLQNVVVDDDFYIVGLLRGFFLRRLILWEFVLLVFTESLEETLLAMGMIFWGVAGFACFVVILLRTLLK